MRSAIFGLLGVVLGWGLSFLTQLWFEKKRKISEKQKLLKIFLMDVTTLNKRYQDVFGQYVESHDEKLVFERYTGIKSDYFSIFDKNTDNLGILEDNILKKLVDFYINGKGFTDTLRDYEEALKRYFILKDMVSKLALTGQPNPLLEEDFRHFTNGMVYSFKVIRDEHNAMKERYNQLKEILEISIK